MSTTAPMQVGPGREYGVLATVLLAAAGLLALLAGCAPPGLSSPRTTMVVSAASDLTPAFTEIGARFREASGIEVTFNFGSTGKLTQQIEQGAPVDLFAAANTAYVDELAANGRVLPDTRTLYARGRITLWTRDDSPLRLETLADLTGPDVARIVIANPDHAPYGVAAREALQSAGVWEAVQPRLVYGENIAQTLQIAESGNVDAGIVALSLSIVSHGRWVLIPEQLYTPLDQEMAVIAGAQHEAAARRFIAFVNGEEGRAIMRRYGFVLPGEELSP